MHFPEPYPETTPAPRPVRLGGLDTRTSGRRAEPGCVPAEEMTMPEITITMGGEDYDEEVELPACYEVCPECEGRGVHDHPAFRNGISAEGFAEDPDFREDYFRGHYDVPCSECDGKRVVLVVDESKLSAAQLERYQEWQADDIAYRSERAAEQRMRDRGLEW